MGLPTGLLLAKAGYQVKGFDVDGEKIEKLRQGVLPFSEPGLKELYQEAQSRFQVSTILEPSDGFIVTVPTPLTTEDTCDLSFVRSAVGSICEVLGDGNLVVVESTVPPGTTRKLVKPLLDDTGKFYYLSYVSEKAIPGNTLEEMQMNHRIIGGIDPESAEKTQDIYESFVRSPIHLTDATMAETVKLLENSYRDVNIALANEFAQRLASQGIDTWEAIRLANLHPRVNIHSPGPGVGGHCIPIDPWFLVSESTPLLKQARQVNERMPEYVIGLLKSMLEPVDQPVVVLLGVSYKGDVDDSRESPSLQIQRLAENQGMQVRLYDPYVTSVPGMNTDLNQAVENADGIILVTDHEMFQDINPAQLENMRQKVLVDTRNILDHDRWRQAGFTVTVLGT